MKQGWEIKKLSQLFDVKSSRRVHQADWMSSGIPFYRAREVVKLARDGMVENELFISQELYDEFTKEKGAPKTGDIIVSAVGTLGQCYLVKDSDKFYFKDASVLWFENMGKVNSRYIEYAFKADSIMAQVMDGSMGATVGTLTISRAKDIEIPLPPLPEQQRIVAILDEAFAAIAKAKANAEQNLKNAKELFESFLQGVFENKGQGWEEKKLAEVADLIDSLHTTPKYTTEGYPMVRVTDIKPGFLNLSKTKKVEKKTFDNFSKRYTPKIGDIVLSRVGSYGVSAIVNTNEPFCLGQNTVFLIPKINSNYFYYFLNSAYAKKQIDKMVAGTTQPTISLKSIKEISVPQPNSKEQKIIVEKIEALSTETKRLEVIYTQKLSDLEELKKSILQKAFSGELKTATAVV
jgi:type I restriction enzyme S subunit